MAFGDHFRRIDLLVLCQEIAHPDNRKGDPSVHEIFINHNCEVSHLVRFML